MSIEFINVADSDGPEVKSALTQIVTGGGLSPTEAVAVVGLFDVATPQIKRWLRQGSPEGIRLEEIYTRMDQMRFECMVDPSLKGTRDDEWRALRQEMTGLREVLDGRFGAKT